MYKAISGQNLPITTLILFKTLHYSEHLKKCTMITAYNVLYSGSMTKYRIAGNFRGVQIFAFFEDAHLSAKLNYRPSSTLKIAAGN